MDRLITALVLWLSLAACGGPPPPPPPPPECKITPAECESGKVDAAVCECVPVPLPPPPPPPSKAADYIQWTCHLSKPTCQDRFSWAESLDDAYTVWRGERDLSALLAEGRRYLKGGDRALVDFTPAELGVVIEHMAEVNARGDRLIYRITTERHRNFQSDPVAPWHRSQVRKDVARTMRDELEDETGVYNKIERQLPDLPGCDAIACVVRKMNEGGNR